MTKLSYSGTSTSPHADRPRDRSQTPGHSPSQEEGGHSSDCGHSSARRYADKDERARQDTEVSGPQERDKEAMEPKISKGSPYRSRGTPSSQPNLRKHLDSVDCNLSISNIQKTALLGSARILRMVLDI